MKVLVFLCTLILAGLQSSCLLGGSSGGGTGGEGISGSLVDPAGSSVPGAMVMLYPEDYLADSDTLPTDPQPDTVMTDSAGRFEFRGVKSGRYNLGASLQRGDSILALLTTGIEVRAAVSLESKVLKPTGTLLVRVRYLHRDVPLEGASCTVPGSSYRALSDSTGLCTLAVASGSHRIRVSFPGMHPDSTESLTVEPNGLQEGLEVVLYPRSGALPRTTAIIKYVGRNEFIDSVEEGALMLLIAVGGEARCDDDTSVVWDDDAPVNDAEFTFMGMGESFDMLEDLAVGMYGDRPANNSRDAIGAPLRRADLKITAVTATEVTGSYTVKDSTGVSVRAERSFRALKCPHQPFWP